MVGLVSEPTKDMLRVVLDDELKGDLERARKVTGIRSQSDLVRYCVRQVADSKPIEGKAS